MENENKELSISKVKIVLCLDVCVCAQLSAFCDLTDPWTLACSGSAVNETFKGRILEWLPPTPGIPGWSDLFLLAFST